MRLDIDPLRKLGRLEPIKLLEESFLKLGRLDDIILVLSITTELWAFLLLEDGGWGMLPSSLAVASQGGRGSAAFVTSDESF